MRDGDFGAGQAFGIRNGVHAFELENKLIAVHPGALHFHGNLIHQDVFHPFGMIAERDGSQLSLVSAGSEKTGDGDELQNYSRISSVNRRLSFIPAAPSSVRMDRAVRPVCR